MISSRGASYIRTSLSGQIWRLLASTKLIISIRLSQRQMELQPGCDPGAGTGCTGLIARVHTHLNYIQHSQTTTKCPAQVDLAGVGAEVEMEVEVGAGLFTSS